MPVFFLTNILFCSILISMLGEAAWKNVMKLCFCESFYPAAGKKTKERQQYESSTIGKAFSEILAESDRRVHGDNLAPLY